MVWHKNTLKDMETLLDAIANHQTEYASLLEYYYSDQRNQDLQDEKNDLIPKTMARGVLSEDGIFDLVGDYRDTAIRMMEVALQMFKA